MQSSDKYMQQNRNRLLLSYLTSKWINIAGLKETIASIDAKITEAQYIINERNLIRKELVENLEVWQELNGPKYSSNSY